MTTKSKKTVENDTIGDTVSGFAGLNGVNPPTLEALQKGVERTVEMNKENIEAFVESMTAATKGLEVLGGESLSFAKQVIEDGVKASKGLMSAKSPQEFFTLHGDYSRSVFDQIVNQATKVNDLGMTAMKNAYAPLNDRVTTMSKVVQKARTF